MKDYRDLSTHAQRFRPVATGPSPTFLIVVEAVTLALMLALVMQ